MNDNVTALLVALARENADLREQLASAQDMLMEAAGIWPSADHRGVGGDQRSFKTIAVTVRPVVVGYHLRWAH